MPTEEDLKRLEDKIDSQQEKIYAIYISVEKTRKYFFWTMVITIAVFVLPLIGLAFVLPSFMSNYTTNLEGLGI